MRAPSLEPGARSNGVRSPGSDFALALMGEGPDARAAVADLRDLRRLFLSAATREYEERVSESSGV